MRFSLSLSKLIFWFLIIFLTLTLASGVLAQESDPNQAAQKYGISFPIDDLGGCTDVASCKTFCEDPVNKNACISFAKQKGFYKEDGLSTKKEQILRRAQQVLGCNSEDACKALCQEESNRNQCDQFAKQNGLQGGHVEDPAKGQIIQKAQEELGCNSEDSCKSICSEEANREKCSNFAKKVGLRGGHQRVGPGGCNSEGTCKAFCSDPNNFQECSKFGPPLTSDQQRGPGSGFVGPGGCDSESSCRAYCQSHPGKCGNFSEDLKPNQPNSASPVNSPSSVHPPTTEELGCKTPAECYDICKKNPERCPGFHPSQQRPNDNTQIQKSGPNPGSMSYEQQQAGCKAGGGSCSGSRNNATFCDCMGYQPPTSGSSSNTAAPSSSYSGGMSRAEQETMCKSTGGSCTSSDPNFCGCQMSNSGSSSNNQPPSTSQPSSESTMSQNPPPPQSSPAVQGAAYQSSILEKLWGVLVNYLKKD